MTTTCANCVSFFQNPSNTNVGICKFLPPQPASNAPQPDYSHPTVVASDWCSQWDDATSASKQAVALAATAVGNVVVLEQLKDDGTIAQTTSTLTHQAVGLFEVTIGNTIITTTLFNDGTTTTATSVPPIAPANRLAVSLNGFSIDASGYGYLAVANDGTMWQNLNIGAGLLGWSQISALPTS